MSFFVDPSLCRHCGLCASGCVCGLLSLSENGLPRVDPARPDGCVRCGHCACVCPTGAISLDGMAPGDLAAFDGPLPERSVSSLLMGRRAMRNFLSGAVDRDALRRALALAAYAPTAHNARQVAYTVINGRAKVERLLAAAADLMERHGVYPGQVRNVRSGRDTLFRGAPCLILIHAPERVLSEADCATAACYLELALPSLGLASCWAGMLVEACAHGLPEGLDIPEGHRLYAALMVGRPEVGYRRIPWRPEPAVAWI